MTRSPWNRLELIVAFNLYCKIPFTKIHFSHKDIRSLASIIDRTPSAVALKLVNFARLDPMLQERKVSGMSHGSKAEIDVWDEFHGNWEELAYQSECALAQMRKLPLEQSANVEVIGLPREGKTREQVVRVRVNQSFFRAAVVSSYDNCCCITGLSLPQVLVASHIMPWAVDEKNRVNPSNGLCMNALHDRAFDLGLITITPSFVIKMSKSIFAEVKNEGVRTFFLPYIGTSIRLPHRFAPDKDFLVYHNKHIFIG